MQAAALVEKFRRIVGEDGVLVGKATRRAYDCDAYTVDRSEPEVVLLPRNTEQVAETVRICASKGIPFVARGAGTGLSGGALAAKGGVIISTKRMTSVLEVDATNRRLRAQAGIANIKISQAVHHLGLHFAPDPSSQSVSTLGGNIAENSGGPHTLKYGVTVQHILGLRLVTAEGAIVDLGDDAPGSPGCDFVGIIVGGEGTMGIVTEATVKLTPLPLAIRTLLAAFPTTLQATEVVAEVISSGVVPAALEMMDEGILMALTAAFDLTYPVGTKALLLIECDSTAEGAEAKVGQEARIVSDICLRHSCLSLEEAQDEDRRKQMWLARKKGIGAMGRLAPSIVTHDGVIPRSKLPEMLEFVYAVANRTGLGVANLFHAGDGNLHPCFYFDDRSPEQLAKVIESSEEIIRKCLELGGSVSGEHGIGVEKIDLMPLMFSPSDLVLQCDVKRIFNDGDLCNPCKVFPNQKGCIEHAKRWRGVAW